ncbi:uncharacterized protein L203_102075 [Cryptococcus depauperatus CBS 7841]|uniref:NADH dehydrogenase [ubiquinone] 1 alpha subcomplex assembly factor 3 n=1 Tax=Cryptococcus depauperatus CBS 7841 TaxID=1295531 RepID=A0A1E3IRQ2_9TREE|nr:hypothetical protein L203_01327 [Cryptococcus depauperatus CBS 7841]
MAFILKHAHTIRPLTRPTAVSYPQYTAVLSFRRHLQNIIAPEQDSSSPRLTVKKLTPRGLILSDDLVIRGGTILHSGKALLWDVDPPKQLPPGTRGALEKAWEGWESDRFAVFDLLVPRPEILLFGTGQRVWPVPTRIRDYISSLGIQLDVMDSRNAASTYNLLVEEGRVVAAALCPLEPIDPRTGNAR